MSKPPPGKDTWADPAGDFTITLARKRDETMLPAPEVHYPLDEVIRALDEGDGAALQEHRDEIKAWLVELRRYRATIACAMCKRTVVGRAPVCVDCYAESVRKLFGEVFDELRTSTSTKKDRAKAALRAKLERKLGR